jgi:hypothetical protein
MSTAPRPEELHSADAVASDDENRISVPADVIVSLAHSVIGALRAENSALQAENARLKRRLSWAAAIWKPADAVIQ